MDVGQLNTKLAIGGRDIFCGGGTESVNSIPLAMGKQYLTLAHNGQWYGLNIPLRLPQERRAFFYNQPLISSSD